MVHYQSSAQVPAPCVGKARQPPVLQVSTIQTPREGGGPQGRGGASRRCCHSHGFALSLLLEQTAWGADPGPRGWQRKQRGWGFGGWRGGRGQYEIYELHLLERGVRGGFGPLHSPNAVSRLRAEGGHRRPEHPRGGQCCVGVGASCPRVGLLGPLGACLDLT